MPSKSPQLTDRQNYNAIDLAKFLCAILVVMGHIKPLGTADPGSLAASLNFGIQSYLVRIAVPFFFMSSGFLLYRKTSYETFDFSYTKQYLIRIARLYIIWTLIYFPLVYRVYLSNEKGLLYACLTYVRDFIFTGTYPHLWYFPALMFAVFLVSFLLSKKIRPRHILMLSAVFYFLGLFAQSWFGFILPLKEQTPDFWNLLLLLEDIIVSTRDGLFDGFIFVSLGMCIVFYKIRIEKKKAFLLFVLSMLALLIEVFLLQHHRMIREYDMYLFLVPATFFFFCLTIEIKLPDSPVYKTLRSMSYLIYFAHLWVYFVVTKLLFILFGLPKESPFHFIITLLITIALSYLAVRLSDCKGFRWLKVFYT